MKNYIVAAVTIILSVLISVLLIHPGVVPNANLGSVSGPDDSFPCKSTNGVTTCSEQKPFSNASTTLVSFRSPAATSTLRIAAASITTATTTAYQFEWGRSPQFDATSTTLGNFLLAASVKAVVSASTTPYTSNMTQTVDYAYIIPPNTFVNLKYGGICTAGIACNTLKGSAIVQFSY